MTWRADVLFAGEAKGQVLRFGAPISFWGGVNPDTSEVTLAGHPQLGLATRDKILVIPHPVGSSSSSSVVLELLYKGIAPAALILGRRDAILPVGVVVARQMDWPTIPVLVMPDPPFQSNETLSITRDGTINEL